MPTVLSLAGNSWYLDGECAGYNQNSWKCSYDVSHGPQGSWIADPKWTAAQRGLLLGGETAMWGEGITQANFDSFVWRPTAAVAERLWTSEEDLGCPATSCPGIKTGTPSYWLSDHPGRLSDQLCRMTQQGIPTGPINPGFCPADAQ